MNVSTTRVSVGSGVLIQNLGPDDLYVGEDTVTTSNGVRVATDYGVAVGSGFSVYVVSEGTSDVRVLPRGSGIFATPATP